MGKTLAEETVELAERAGQEAKSLRTLINGNVSDLSALDTTTKTHLVAALNELKAAIDAVEVGGITAEGLRTLGALMDDEISNLADVKAFAPADYATAAQGSTADTALQPGDVVDDLTTGGAAVPLSAAQGVVLKGLIDAINTLLSSDEATLDELQEIVDYIQLNRSDLDSLGISSIAGLQTALDGKAASSHTHTASQISDSTADGRALLTSTDANPFTDADETKLDGIETGADKTATYIGQQTITPVTWGTATNLADDVSAGDSSEVAAHLDYYDYDPATAVNTVLYLPTTASDGDRIRVRIANDNSIASGNVEVRDEASPYTLRHTVDPGDDVVAVFTHDGSNWSYSHEETPEAYDIRPDASNGRAQDVTLQGGTDNSLDAPVNLADGQSMRIIIEQAGTPATALTISDSLEILGSGTASDVVGLSAGEVACLSVTRYGNRYLLTILT